MKSLFVFFSVLLIVLVNHVVSPFGLAGGMSKEKPADAEIQELAEKMKESVEDMLNRKFKIFEAKSYSTQVVAGTNYFIKVKVSDNEYVHIRVFQPLPYTGQGPELSNAVDAKKGTDPLDYIEAGPHFG